MKFQIDSFRFSFFTIPLLALFLPSTALPEEPYMSFFEKARNLDQEEFLEDAENYWLKTLEANPPENIILYTKLKLTHTNFRLGNLKEAFRISKSLTGTHPNHYDSWFHFAYVLASLKKYPQAVEAFKNTTALRPQEGLGWFGLALAYFGAGKPDSAIEELKEAMKIFKSNKNISWYRDCRLAINQIKGFARFPKNFSELWLGKNFKRVQDTYLNTVLDLDLLLEKY